jgi:hypothetical protein
LHDGIALIGLVTVGNEVIGLLPITAIDFVGCQLSLDQHLLFASGLVGLGWFSRRKKRMAAN